MIRTLRASAVSGTVSLPLFFLIGIARSRDAVEVSISLLLGLLITEIEREEDCFAPMKKKANKPPGPMLTVRPFSFMIATLATPPSL